MTSLPLILAICWVLGGATITMKHQIYINSSSDMTFTDNIIFVSAARSRLHCAVQCNQHDSCMTFTFHDNTCTGYEACKPPSKSSSSASTPATGARSFARENIGNSMCKRTGVKRLIYTSLGLDRDVYCDCDWLVFQRRINGSVDFYRGWNDYVTGFGDAYGEYWLGLENLHRITTSGVNYELRVILTTFSGTIGTASYSNFSVGPATDKYRLHFDSFLGGNAGDSLLYQRGQQFSTFDADNDISAINCAVTYHGQQFSTFDADNDISPINCAVTYHGQQFSTFDADNDISAINCAVTYHGGWWYKGCYTANWNGDYKSTEMMDATGIRCDTFNPRLTLKSCQMMIRPV